MCDYCRIRDDKVLTNVGIIQQQPLRKYDAKLNVYLVRKRTDTKEFFNNNMLNITVTPRIGYTSDYKLCDLWLDIRYCPFCGEKL